jgi:uncharacterized protein YllA (UPF0747 family)
MAPHLLRALQIAPALQEDLDRRAGELATAGSDPGVALGDGATLVMLEARLGRDRLVQDGTGFLTRRSGERFSLAKLSEIASNEPERLSPNVLLRPVVERALLATVAYIGGPGELRYLELTPPLYQQLGVPRQLPVPRWSGLVVEPRVDRVLEKYGSSVDELLRPGQVLEARILRTQLPPEAGRALTALREALEREYAVLAAAAAEIDPTIERPVQASLYQALAATREVEKRLVQHLKKRADTEMAQISRARAALLPLGKPQERVLTIAPFLARHGPALLQGLQAAILEWYREALEGSPVPS